MFFGYSARSPHRTTKPSRGWVRVGVRKPRLVLSEYRATRNKVTATPRSYCRGCEESPSPPLLSSRKATSNAGDPEGKHECGRAGRGRRRRRLVSAMHHANAVLSPKIFSFVNLLVRALRRRRVARAHEMRPYLGVHLAHRQEERAASSLRRSDLRRADRRVELEDEAATILQDHQLVPVSGCSGQRRVRVAVKLAVESRLRGDRIVQRGGWREDVVARRSVRWWWRRAVQRATSATWSDLAPSSWHRSTFPPPLRTAHGAHKTKCAPFENRTGISNVTASAVCDHVYSGLR